MTESVEGEIRTLRGLFWSERDPEGRAFAPLADAYRRSGDVKQAIELLNDGLDRLPHFSPGHVVAARLWVERGLFAEGEIAARAALDLDPENVDALGSLASALEARGETVELQRVRNQLAALEPDDAVAVEEPVDALEDLDFGTDAAVGDEALPDFAAAAEPAPDEPEEEIADLGAFAPDEPEEEIADLGAFAPDEPEEEIADLGAFAPDEPEEEIADLGAFAPDEPEEEIADLGAFAPDEPEEETADLGAFAPDDAAATLDPFDMGVAADGDGADAGAEASADPINTRTMAELYVEQGLLDRAADVYRALVDENPDDDELRSRLDGLEIQMASGGGAGAAPEEPEDEAETLARDLAGSGDDEHEVDTPFAWARDDAPESVDDDGPSVGDFFDSLFGRGGHDS